LNGNYSELVQAHHMNTNPRSNGALVAAEEILRIIFGDDLKGCNVTLEQIAGVIQNSFHDCDERTRELIGLYEKVVEAVGILSTPPDQSKVNSPVELQALLGDRLDKIHTISKKTMETSALFRSSEGKA
jgi:hypothetical protein